MPWYRMRTGAPLDRAVVHMNFGRGKQAKNAPKQCRAKCDDGTYCCCMSEFECDWPGCDKPLCRDCAHEIKKNYHLCPDHRFQPGIDIGEGDGEQQMTLV